MGCITSNSSAKKIQAIDKDTDFLPVYVANNPLKSDQKKTFQYCISEIPDNSDIEKLKKSKKKTKKLKQDVINCNEQKSEKKYKTSQDIDDCATDYQKQAVKKYQEKFDAGVTAKYEIKALIGKGSFSRVVRVEQRTTKQPYAIKLINKLESREVFEAELGVLRRVRHAHVIRLIEVYDTPTKVYMVLELATGGELLDRIIEKGYVTELDGTRVMSMVLEGLRYLHSLGITHRDLKPENLLYYHPGCDSRILITDFGLSHVRRSGSDEFMHTTCGTPEYIAPEILARRPYTDLVDMWAAGVIGYILLSGKMPFDADSRPMLYKQILKSNYSYRGDPWPDISSLAKDFIDKLLVVDSGVRLSAAQSLKHPWIARSAPGSSSKNLHRTISRNLLQRQSTRTSQSQRSTRSQNHRVRPEEIDQLHQDPEVQAELSSLCSTPK